MEDKATQGARVLVFDADPGRAEDLSDRLRFLKYRPFVAAGNAKISRTLPAPVAILLGELTAALDVRRRFAALTKEWPDLPVLALSRESLDVALTGAPIWRLDRPLRRSQLAQLLRRAERFGGRERRLRLTGSSPSIRAVRQLIEQVADFDTSVLVTGESGTGKELVARTIHDLSARAGRPFVPINCGAIPPDLLESELFGHEKGAFSGAVSARTGRFELADGGTLFLDEIGDMSLPMQVKLLRVLQERSFERVGSNRSRKCDVRIVAATHRDLPAAVKNGEFREDLYYRLNVFPLALPPLCKRRSDLPQLLDELLVRHRGENDNGEGHGSLRLSAEALRALARYSWPGNVRELSNLVERLAILYPTGEISLEDLPPKYRQGLETQGPETRQDDIKEHGMPAAGESPDARHDLKSYLQQIEQDIIREAMRESSGVVAKAARRLKMRRTTLVEKLGKYAIA